MPNKYLRHAMYDQHGSFKIARAKLWLKTGGKCWLCLGTLEVEETTFDHVIPLSKGGLHSWDNLMPAHEKCNQAKGNKSPHKGVNSASCNIPKR